MKPLRLILTLALVLNGAVSFANDDDKDKGDKEKTETTLQSMIEDKTAYPGLLPVYRDPKTGKGFISLQESQLDQSFIYFAVTTDGAVDAGHFRGAFRDYHLVTFRRHFDRVDIVHKTPRFYFDPNSALAKAADANISEAVLVSVKIANEEDGTLLLPLEKIFLNESLQPVAPWPSGDAKRDKKRFKPGKFSKDKSRIVSINNFAENTHIAVDYVFENSKPTVRGGSEISDPRFTSIELQHAFIAAPDKNFKPRRDDARVGYFGQQFDDMLSDQTTNYRDVINRWHLEKKDPSAAVSDPVEPIVWWIENTTPVEWRDTIRDATLAWNSAFEKAGISNAIEVKIQPDDATWHADDVRYNVLRWTSSPRPPFGGYGPSIAHPLTGQIIAADIMLEYTFMKGRWIAAQMFTDGAAPSTESPLFMPHSETTLCSLGHGLNLNTALAQTAGLVDGMGEIDKDRLLKQSMYYLILHEVGHTLGLNHNMRATQLHALEDVHNMEKTQGILAGSVMDYPSVNYAPKGTQQGDFYSMKPGPYDDWAIYYGYSQGLDDDAAEAKRLDDILARSAEPELAFGNDADDMRAPGRHIDPRVNIWDMSGDAIGYAEQRLGLINSTAESLLEKVLVEGRSHQDVVVGANVLFAELYRQADVTSRYIGGVFVERAVVGQPGYTQPFTPVPLAQQQRAMALLTDHIFAPTALDSMESLWRYTLRQRRGFGHFGRNEDPKVHAMLLAAHKRVFDHLLHPSVMQRLTDTQLYGNEYSVNAMLGDLTAALFAADRKDDISTLRQNAQTEYVERLIAISGLMKPSKHDHVAQAAATFELDKLLDSISSRGDQASKAHRFYLKNKIQRAFEA